MRRLLARLLVVAIGIQPALLQAQQASTRQDPPAPRRRATAPGHAADDVLAGSFERVRRALAEAPRSKNAIPLKLDFYVEVVGQAPRIELFTAQDMAAGPVPGMSPPTHGDMLGVMTPQAFRSGAVPISTLAVMGIAQLIKWQRDVAKRRQQEEAEKKRQQDQTSVAVQAPRK